jgi:hypothetical protein
MNPLEKAFAAQEHTKIQPEFPYAYYTCVRPATSQIHHVSIGKDIHEVFVKQSELSWDCTKGWYEFYDNHPGGYPIEAKVVKYCKFGSGQKALEKALGINTDGKWFKNINCNPK